MTETNTIMTGAVSLGFIHVLAGPDHYVPFAALAWERKWSAAKTLAVTFLCGLGHILGSVLLGAAGILFGATAGRLEALESFRGGLAGWALLAFGLVYFVWGLKKAYARRHGHDHPRGHGWHHHGSPGRAGFWVLFLIFVFGPCEPLIPLLMYPALRGGWMDVALVSAVFGAATIGTMVAVVSLSLAGIRWVPSRGWERFSPALAGASLLACGAAVVFVGL